MPVNEGNARTLLMAARESRKLGKHDQSLHEAEAAATQAAEDCGLLLEIADLLFDMNQIEKSVEVLRNALLDHPDNSRLLLDLGKYLRHAGRVDEALHVLRHAFEVDSNNPRIYSTYANMLADAGRISDAADIYSLALKENPSDKGAWAMLASLKQRAGDVEGWLAAYSRVYELGRESIHVAMILAEALIKSGRFEKARTVLDTALGYQPKNVDLHYKLSHVLLKLALHREALAANARASDAAPGNAGFILQRAEIYERMGAFDDSLETIRELLETPSVSIPAALMFVKISPYLGMADQARKLLSYIIRRDRLDPIPEKISIALNWLDETE
jgi:tetratricopeptide (TPR) repeat protein